MRHRPRPRPEDCLLGGGEMGALMRAFDWSRTPVGPVTSWPQSLRTAVSMMLESKFGTYVAWGHEFTQFYNDVYRPILGSTKHPALGKSTRDTFAEIWPIIGPMFDGVMRGEAVGADDIMLPLDRHGFAEECYFILSYSPIRDETGGVGGVLVTVTESTARVLAQRRLATLRDLAACASTTQTVDEAWERSFNILTANPSDLPFVILYRVAGTDATLVGASGTGQSAAAPSRIALDGHDPWGLAGAMASAAPLLVGAVIDRFGPLSGGPWPEPPRAALILPIHRAGAERPYGVLIVGVSPRLLLDASYQEFLSMIAGHVGTGIANASAYEEERRRAQALAEIDRAKTAFFSNVSHEFRTPLALMLGPLRDLLGGAAGEQREQLEVVHRNAQRLLKLVNSLLDFSRIEAGRAQASFEPTDLPRLTADLASAFRSAVERAGLQLAVECPPLPEAIYVDHDMWEKIVLNLLSNAFKFTFEGEIAVRLEWTGEGARLTVRDTGTGIPPEELPRIFERFHRVASARGRTHEGTGIGLALVQELVRQHGGTLGAASVLGQGTTFTVTIPAGRDHLPADRVAAPAALASTSVGAAPFVTEALRWVPDEGGALPAAEPPDAAAVTTTGHVLVADDNADMRDYLRRILAPHWRVTAVSDGLAALAAARRIRPDLVLTDVMMPGLDGFGLLRALREDPDVGRVPVIMLSARAGEEARVDGLQAGADDYLVKPFSARELVARVEAQLLRARIRTVEDALRRRMAAIFSHAPVAVAILRGPAHVFEFANTAYLDLIDHREVLGRPLREAIPELEGQGLYEMLDEAYATGRPYIGRSQRVLFRRTRDGDLEEGFFDFVCQPTFDERRVDGIAVVGFEVTDLARAREEAELANRSKDEFLAMLGHELRNPLSPILTALQLIHRRGVDGHARELSVIERQVRHMVTLVDDLLDVSRITRGKIELNRTRVSAADIVARALEIASPVLEGRQHTVAVDVDPSATLYADATRLRQVISNLLTNAGKYTEPGGRVEVRGRRDGDDFVLAVSDTGVGISEALLPRVFDMFVQGKRSIDRAEGGLGLGLALVRSLVELHGGSVHAASEGPGRGSTFTVRLPLVAAGPPEAAERGVPARPGDAAPAPRRVLVVDDNHDAAQMLADLLSDEGHLVRVAYDGPSALAAAEEFQPDLALLDIGLPVMDGYELSARLRQMRAEIRLIAISGYGRHQDRQRALSAGFETHLVKPVDLDRLREALGEISRL